MITSLLRRGHRGDTGARNLDKAERRIRSMNWLILASCR
jgi:hypothetical protein